MRLLKDILLPLQPAQVLGDTGVEINNICIDSRKVAPGTVFVALRGTVVDGHSYIAKAIADGAVAIVCEELPAERNDNVTYIKVKDSSAVAGLMADAFYDNPSQSMKVVGVTGTNGKTTVATLLFNLFTALGYKCGLISTVQNHIGDTVEVSTHTTPDAISVQALLSKMADAHCSHVFMEVSSHAVHQSRIKGIRCAGGVFTNITHHHLDYHKTLDE